MPAMLPIFATFLLAVSPAGQIAYVSEATTAQRCVVVMDVASRSVTRVGPGKRDGAPRWSPNGEWLAFDTERASGSAIYLVRWDGSEGRYLRHAQPVNRDPSWSPDGLKLAFVSGAGPERQIVVYEIATNRESRWGGGRRGLMAPRWMARGLVVSLLGSEDKNRSVVSPIILENLNQSVGLVAIGLTEEEGKITSNLVLVTATESVAFPERVFPSPGNYAEWNATPARRDYAIAFESDDGGDREIFLYSRKGIWDLSNHRAADWNPVWAPGNSWLAFESFRSGRRGVYRVHREAATVYPVAVSERASNWWPSWSPDGDWLAFVSDRTGVPNVYITDVAGEHAEALTKVSTGAVAPAWRPRR